MADADTLEEMADADDSAHSSMSDDESNNVGVNLEGKLKVELPALCPTVIDMDVQPASFYSTVKTDKLNFGVSNKVKHPRSCMVKVCGSTTHLFTIPTEVSLKEAWLSWLSTLQEVVQVKKQSAICFRHFKNEDISNFLQYRLTKDEKIRLKLAPKAVPCIVAEAMTSLSQIQQPPLNKGVTQPIFPEPIPLKLLPATGSLVKIEPDGAVNCGQDNDEQTATPVNTSDEIDIGTNHQCSCMVGDCGATNNLFALPADVQLKNAWLKWLSTMQKEVIVNTHSALCFRHFKKEDITNLTQYQLMSDETLRLTLAPKAVPCIAAEDMTSQSQIQESPIIKGTEQPIILKPLTETILLKPQAASLSFVTIKPNDAENLGQANDGQTVAPIRLTAPSAAHIKRRHRRICMVGGCGITKNLFALPADVQLKNAWLKWLSTIQKEVKVNTHSSVCFRHFRREDIANLAQYQWTKDETMKLRLEPKAVPSIISAEGITSPSQMQQSPLTKRAKRAILRDALADPIPLKYWTVNAPIPKKKPKKLPGVAEIPSTVTTASEGTPPAGHLHKQEKQKPKKKYKSTTCQTESAITGLPPPPVTAPLPALTPMQLKIPAHMPLPATIQIVPSATGAIATYFVDVDETASSSASTSTIDTANVTSITASPSMSPTTSVVPVENATTS